MPGSAHLIQGCTVRRMIARSASFRAESFCPNRGIFTAQPEAIEKKLRSRGGSYAASSLTHMNRHKHEHAGKTKTESKP